MRSIHALLTSGAIKLGIAAILFTLAGPVHATLMMQLQPGDPTPYGSNFEYTYEMQFIPSSGAFELRDGDFVTIYDLQWLVSATAPTGFSVSINNTGINATGTSPLDDPALPNITFTRSGGTVTSGMTFMATVVSRMGITTLKPYTAQDTELGTTAIPHGTAGRVLVPGVPTTGVPEPGSMALFGFGIIGLLGLYWRQRRPRKQV